MEAAPPAARALSAQNGHALLSALIATALLLPLGGFAVMQARLDFLVQHHTRAATETLAVAEAGLAHALVDLTRDPRFERLLVGPDRRAGTGDDGEFPFDTPPPVFFPTAPFRYAVRVAAHTPAGAEIIARGFGPLGAQRAVAAAVERSSLPYLPAAVATDAAVVDLLLERDWSLEGTEAAGGAPDVPALALQSQETVEHLLRRMTSEEAGRLRGPGGPPSLAVAAIPAVAALLDVARGRPEAQVLGSEATGALGDGVFVRSGALGLRDASGSGLLIVDGALAITGALAFDGLIAIAGDLRVDPGADVTVVGAILQGAPGRTIVLRGRGRIVYHPPAMERLAAAYPGLMPARARVTGWRELADVES